jgi:LuxR family maltose regulon positive regulatory protein
MGRPYLEFMGLTFWAHGMMLFRPDGLLPTRARQAVELAERHGWGEEPPAGIAYTVLGGVLLYQGRLADAEPWLERAERTLRTEAEPAAGMSLRFARAVLEMARGRYPQALTALEGAEKLAGQLVRPHLMVASIRTRMVQALIRAGQAGRAAAIMTGPDENERANAEARTAAAALQLAGGDPRAAADVLVPVLEGLVPEVRQVSMITALLLQAAARDALGDRAAAGRSLERALDIAESTGILLPFLLDPLPTQLERHRTAYPALLAQILGRWPPPGARRAPPGGPGGRGGLGGKVSPQEQGGSGGDRPPGANRAAHRQRGSHPALPAHPPDGAGDRQRAVPVGAHHHHPHAPPVRQARSPPPPPGRRARARPRPARTRPVGLFGHAGRPGITRIM